MKTLVPSVTPNPSVLGPSFDLTCTYFSQCGLILYPYHIRIFAQILAFLSYNITRLPTKILSLYAAV